MKSLRLKILLGFLLVIALSTSMSVYNYFSISNINHATTDIVSKQLPLLLDDEALAFNISQRIALARGYVLYGDESYKELFDQYTEESQKLQEEVLSYSNSKVAEDLIAKSTEWQKLVIEEVFTNYDQGNQEKAKEILREEVQPLARDLMAGFEEMAKNRRDIIISDGDKVINQGDKTLLLSLIISILVLVSGLVVSYFVAAAITNPIQHVKHRMNAIASGDLSGEPLETKTKDEIAQLVLSTNAMSESLRSLIREVAEVSESVTSQSEELTQSASEVKEGSIQVASTMQELANGSQSQADTSTDLATAMEHFTVKVQEASENGERVSVSSKEVLEMTNEGSTYMDTSVEHMQSINTIVKQAVTKVKGLDQQSQQISKLVDVIKDISDQTNLLALNAAIEAARAGEHGKGFSVVADEVRKLAEQVSVSVTDITDIVKNIQAEAKDTASSLEQGYNRVEEGTNQIQITGKTFDQIEEAVLNMVNRISTISENMMEITASTQQMNSSIEEIAAVSEESAAGIEQTSASVQQTTSSMEEIAGSSNSLSILAEKLNEHVRKFKL